MENSYRIEPAKSEHLAALPAIERTAADVFPEGMISDQAKDFVLSMEEFENALAQKHLWVAITANDQPVSFSLVTVDASGKSAMCHGMLLFMKKWGSDVCPGTN